MGGMFGSGPKIAAAPSAPVAPTPAAAAIAPPKASDQLAKTFNPEDARKGTASRKKFILGSAGAVPQVTGTTYGERAVLGAGY